jgi:hypothetical protein
MAGEGHKRRGNGSTLAAAAEIFAAARRGILPVDDSHNFKRQKTFFSLASSEFFFTILRSTQHDAQFSFCSALMTCCLFQTLVRREVKYKALEKEPDLTHLAFVLIGVFNGLCPVITS